MDNKDYEILIEEYEKLNEERADIYPLTFDEYVDGLRQSFSKPNFISAPIEKQIKVALRWISEGRPLMKYYNAFKERDMKALNNSLYETAHLKQICNTAGTGSDHGFYGMKITPELLAANMMERVKILLPKENGLGSYNFSGTHIANLLMCIIHKDFEYKEEALDLAEKELEKKIPEYVKRWIKCMRAIVIKDCDMFNEQIIAFCKSYMKCKEFGMNGFNKRFCVEAHGLYNLAIWAYDGELKENINVPDIANFCQELAQYQKDNNYGAGEIMYVYPEKLDVCNRIMNCEPPRMYLKDAGKKKVLDVDRFEQEVVSSLSTFRR